MRGSDTLKFQISRLNGENQNIYAIHPTAFINQPVAAPHQSRQIIGSEVPIIYRDSFPPGEAKGQLRKRSPFNEPLNFPTLRADAIRPYDST